MRLYPTRLLTKPYPPNLAELNLKSKEQRSALRHHLFLSAYMSPPPVASVEENCELDELLGGNVWSSPQPPPASLLAFPGWLLGSWCGSAGAASLASSVSIENQSLGV